MLLLLIVTRANKYSTSSMFVVPNVMLCQVYFIIYIYAHGHWWDPSHTATQGPKHLTNHKMKSGESETISINPQKNSDGQ